MDNTMDRLMTAAVLTWTVLFSLLLPLTAHAQDDDDSAAFVPTTSEEVEEVVESQLRDRGTEVVTTDYAAFPDLYDDVFVASDTVIVTGQIQDHLFAAAGDVKVSGTVGADIFVAAGDVLITGQVDQQFKKDSEKLIKRRASTMSVQDQKALAVATGLDVANNEDGSDDLAPSRTPEPLDLQQVPEETQDPEAINVSNPVAPQANPLYDGVGEQ